MCKHNYQLVRLTDKSLALGDHLQLFDEHEKPYIFAFILYFIQDSFQHYNKFFISVR
jgi:hypothetical protein